MNILVIGGGGREHALIWKLKQSPRVTRLFCAPGNAGIGQLATCAPIAISDHAALVDFARQNAIDLTIVGPDDALAAGLVDEFQNCGLRIFGPRKEAAQLESSKVFSKEFMQRHGLPTAASGHFSDPAQAREFCRQHQYPLVIKADGLALGKGVIIAANQAEADEAIRSIMEERQFGQAGSRVVVEEFLTGQECSIHALVDGKNYILFPAAQDHKQIFDGDQGPNTGGMGAFSPPDKLVTPELLERIDREIMQPFMAGLAKDNLDFRGLLFPGLMITAEGPKLLEFNCRFGDPETQAFLPRLKTDLLDLLEATVDQTLDKQRPEWDSRAAVCVVMASGGYPGKAETGKTISGITDAGVLPDITIFHAGTRLNNDQVVTSGGRVLGVTALGETLDAARNKAYDAVAKIEFEGATFRRDIGAKGL